MPPQTKRPVEKNHVKNRYFLLSFTITFFIMALMAFVAVYIFNPDVPSAEAATAQNYVPIGSDSLTVLLIGQPEDETRSPLFLLAKFSPAEERITVTALPPQTDLISQRKADTLAGVFRLGGGAYARLALTEAMGIPVDRYLVVEEKNFEQVMTLLGPVDYTLPVGIDYREGTRQITMVPGLYQLDGRKALDILSCPNYPGGEVQRGWLAAQMVARVINGRMILFTGPLVDSVFSGIVNLTDTDISQIDYQQRKSAAEYLSRLEAEPAVALEIEGELDETGEHFSLTPAGKDTLTAVFAENETGGETP